MLKSLVGDGQIAAPDDHHTARLAVLEQRQMRQHFGVGTLVARRDLDDVVERHHAPVRHRVEDADALKLALFLDNWRSLELHRLGVALVETLFEGVRHRWLRTICDKVKGEASAFYGASQTLSRA